MSTRDPRTTPSAAVTVGGQGMVCTVCGKRSDYVIAQVGGGYTYQPCGCYGGQATK